MRIAVIGYSCSGKTTLTHELARLYPEMKVVHTDEYQANGFTAAMYQIMDDVMTMDDVIVEGIHTYRLLRKGVETNKLHFDAVIECKTEQEKRILRYTSERDANKLNSLPAFDKSLDKIYSDYKKMSEAVGKVPKIITYTT